MAHLIVFGIIFLLVFLIKGINIEKSLWRTEQDLRVLYEVGIPNEYSAERFKYLDENYMKSELDRKHASYTETYMSFSDPTRWFTNLFNCEIYDHWGTKFLLLAINVNHYEDEMSKYALKFRDIVFSYWHNRPEGWETKYIFELPPGRETCIRHLEKKAEGYLTTLTKYPPGIQEQLNDKKKRKALLKKLNIIPQ